MWGLRDSKGTWCAETAGLKQVAVDFFRDIYSKPQSSSLLDQLKVIQLFPQFFEKDNLQIGKQISHEEVRFVLSNFPVDKSPRSNGWTTEFFLHFFNLISDEITSVVEESRRIGGIWGSLNSTFITLIPKKEVFR